MLDEFWAALLCLQCREWSIGALTGARSQLRGCCESNLMDEAAGAPMGIKKWTDLKSIKKIESVASGDCFIVVGEKVWVEDDGKVLGSGWLEHYPLLGQVPTVWFTAGLAGVMWSDGEDSITGKIEVFSHRLEVRRVDRSKRCMMLKIKKWGHIWDTCSTQPGT